MINETERQKIADDAFAGRLIKFHLDLFFSLRRCPDAGCNELITFSDWVSENWVFNNSDKERELQATGVCPHCGAHIRIFRSVSGDYFPVTYDPDQTVEGIERGVLYKFGHEAGVQPGAFMQAMIEAVLAADTKNQVKLGQGYETLVIAVKQAQSGELQKKYDEPLPIETPPDEGSTSK